MANFNGDCPHCAKRYTNTRRVVGDVAHFTCNHCGWPLVARPHAVDLANWITDGGHWGHAGDQRAFEQLVYRLFAAVKGKSKLGIDCYSGQCGGDRYDGVEAKCYIGPVGPAVVNEVTRKYGDDGQSTIAIVVGEPGFSSEAKVQSAVKGVHLYTVRRADTAYRVERVTV
jgi:hypothetical protein